MSNEDSQKGNTELKGSVMSKKSTVTAAICTERAIAFEKQAEKTTNAKDKIRFTANARWYRSKAKRLSGEVGQARRAKANKGARKVTDLMSQLAELSVEEIKAAADKAIANRIASEVKAHEDALAAAQKAAEEAQKAALDHMAKLDAMKAQMQSIVSSAIAQAQTETQKAS
jgi:hypothetical protein